MSAENDASIDSSTNEGKAHLIVLWKLKNVTIIELSQSEISLNQMNKRPREDECDDAALLPSVKKPHTDFSDLLSDKSSSTLDKSSTSKKAKLEGEDSLSKWFI